ncbi:hypothetical protein ACVIW2_005095 [Bradyrhizobium huanghuaihaiense]|uniref:Uncharacterized protein n=1 Tax=Bradyrhizobium huanghuaihaiense TaxID=990078 RepID=A0A562R7A4_9BRAD|nr:hypothetical protein IQ16_05586 [Bradyrhizobium huanghuaihaiense]
MNGPDAAGPSPFEARRRGEHLRVTVIVRSPDERSDIRDLRERIPGYRFAHPGYGTALLRVLHARLVRRELVD